MLIDKYHYHDYYVWYALEYVLFSNSTYLCFYIVTYESVTSLWSHEHIIFDKIDQ